MNTPTKEIDHVLDCSFVISSAFIDSGWQRVSFYAAHVRQETNVKRSVIRYLGRIINTGLVAELRYYSSLRSNLLFF